MSRRAGATVALYLEDKWSTHVQGKKTSPASKRKNSNYSSSKSVMQHWCTYLQVSQTTCILLHIYHTATHHLLFPFSQFVILILFSSLHHMYTAFPASVLFLKSQSHQTLKVSTTEILLFVWIWGDSTCSDFQTLLHWSNIQGMVCSTSASVIKQ